MMMMMVMPSEQKKFLKMKKTIEAKNNKESVVVRS